LLGAVAYWATWLLSTYSGMKGGAVIPVVGGCGILGNVAAVYILRYEDGLSHIFREYVKMSARITSIVSCPYVLSICLLT
jgi:hypothetical protein